MFIRIQIARNLRNPTLSVRIKNYSEEIIFRFIKNLKLVMLNFFTRLPGVQPDNVLPL